jgi:predicted HicB family RNase H-like nuclease
MMEGTMEYKGYHTSVEYSAEDNCLFGKLLGIDDLVLFEAQSLADFEQEFHAATDDYIEFCEANDKAPQKEYSGQFNVRVPAKLHRQLVMMAQASGKKLNTIVTDALASFCANEDTQHPSHA